MASRLARIVRVVNGPLPVEAEGLVFLDVERHAAAQLVTQHGTDTATDGDVEACSKGR